MKNEKTFGVEQSSQIEDLSLVKKGIKIIWVNACKELCTLTGIDRACDCLEEVVIIKCPKLRSSTI